MPISQEDKKKQIDAYRASASKQGDDLSGINIITNENPNYFVVRGQYDDQGKKIFYSAADEHGDSVPVTTNGKPADVAVAGNHNAVQVPANATGYRVKVDTGSEVQLDGYNNIVRLQPDKPSKPDDANARVTITGSGNTVGFALGKDTSGTFDIQGNSNLVWGGKGPTEFKLGSNSERNRLVGGPSDDTFIDDQTTHSYEYIQWNQLYNGQIFAHHGHNSIKGGAGNDTYVLDVGTNENSIHQERQFKVSFDKKDTAIISRTNGSVISTLASDVETLEIKTHEGAYDFDLSELRKIFNDHNVRVDNAAQGNVTPVTIRIGEDSVTAAAGNDRSIQAKEPPSRY